MSVRDEARRLLDEVPEDRVIAARELLEQLVDEERAARPRRFASQGMGHADHDLGAGAKDIARQELGGEARSA
jgi:hypothetical protein